MVELQWRFAKDSEHFAIITSGQRMVLQMRQVQNTLEVANELHPPIWGEWEDVPVEGIKNGQKPLDSR